MANVAGYESVRSLPSAGTATLSLARKAGTRAAPTYVIHSLGGDDFDTHQSATAARDFIDAAEVQKRAAEASKHWVAVHEIDASAAAFVTDHYEKSIEWLISRRITLSSADLHRLVESTLLGLAALEESCGRGHGNLKPSNVMFTTRKRVSKARVALADPAPGRRARGEARQADLRALGAMIFELVTHDSFSEMDHYPLRPGQFNGKIDRNAEKWAQLCNDLLKPDGDLDLAAARALVAKLKPAKPVLHYAVAALLVLVLGGGIYGIATYRKPVTVEQARSNWQLLLNEYDLWFDDFVHFYGTKDRPDAVAAMVQPVNDPALNKIDQLMQKKIGSRVFPSRMAGYPDEQPKRRLRELEEGPHIQGKNTLEIEDALADIKSVREQLTKLAVQADLASLEKLPGTPGKDAGYWKSQLQAPAANQKDDDIPTAVALLQVLEKRQALREWPGRINGVQSALAKLPPQSRKYEAVVKFDAFARQQLSEIRIMEDPLTALDELRKLADEMAALPAEDWTHIDLSVFKEAVAKAVLDTPSAFRDWFVEAKNSALSPDQRKLLASLKTEVDTKLKEATEPLKTLEEEGVDATTIAAYRTTQAKLNDWLKAQPVSTSKDKFDALRAAYEGRRAEASQLQLDIANASRAARAAWVSSMQAVTWSNASLNSAWKQGFEQITQKRPPVLMKQRELGEVLKSRLSALEKMPALDLAAAPQEMKDSIKKLEAERRVAAMEEAARLVMGGAWQEKPDVLAEPVKMFEAFRQRATALMTPAAKLREGLVQWQPLDRELLAHHDACAAATKDDAGLEAAWAALRSDVAWLKSLTAMDRAKLLGECQAITGEGNNWRLWNAWRALMEKAPTAWSDLKTEISYRDRLAGAAEKMAAQAHVAALKEDSLKLWRQTVVLARNNAEVQVSLGNRGQLAPSFDLTTMPWLYYNDELNKLSTKVRSLDRKQEAEITQAVMDFDARMQPLAANLPAKALEHIRLLKESLKKPTVGQGAGDEWPGWLPGKKWNPDDKGETAIVSWGGHELAFIRLEINQQAYYLSATEVSIGFFADAYKELRRAKGDSMPVITHAERRGLRGWKSDGIEIRLNEDGNVGHWEIDVDLAAGDFGFWGPGMTPAQIKADPSRFKHLPTRAHPMHFVSWEEAERFAAALDCELPSESLWKEALARQGAAGDGKPNVRDEAWKAQLLFSKQILAEKGQQLTSTLARSLNDDSSEPVAEFNDGAAWLMPVGGQGKEFHHLIGNVAEYVVGEGDNQNKAVVIGGSALTSAKRDMKKATAVPSNIGPKRKAYSDAGFRLAFKEPIKPLAERVKEHLKDSGYVLAKL